VLAGDVKSCLPEQTPERARPMQRSDEAAIASARKRIDRLPPLYRKVYNETLELLIESAKGPAAADHADRELTCCADSSLAPEGRAAFGFFYLRQMASTLAITGSKAPNTPLRFAFTGATGALREWAAELSERRLPPHVVDVSDVAPSVMAAPGAELHFVADGAASAGEPGAIVCSFALSRTRPQGDLALWKWPRQRFVELSEGGDGVIRDRAPSLVPYLQRAGYQIARTKPNAPFVGPQILLPWIATQLRYLLNGGSAAVLDASLRDHGYVRRVRHLASLMSPDVLRVLAPMLPGTSGDDTAGALRVLVEAESEDDQAADAAVTAALDVALLGAAIAAIEDTGAHVSFVDLAARELVDYPIRLKSLCSHLTPANAAAALEKAGAQLHLLEPVSTGRVEAWIARGKSFYR
jgi:hypothetical protein